MNMRSAICCAVVLSAALLSGCGNACDHEASAFKSANDKATACGGSGASFDANKCSNNLSVNCSQDDITHIDNYASCLDGLQGCPPATGLSFAAARLGCLQSLSGISAGCLANTQ